MFARFLFAVTHDGGVPRLYTRALKKKKKKPRERIWVFTTTPRTAKAGEAAASLAKFSRFPEKLFFN